MNGRGLANRFLANHRRRFFLFRGKFGYNTPMAANLPRRRWFPFGLGMNVPATSGVRTPADVAGRSGERLAADQTASDQRGVVHALEDILLAVAIAAIASNDEIPGSLARSVVDLLLDAHQDGRVRDVVSAARSEVLEVPDWECRGCLEPNPSTFEICWNCGGDQPDSSPRPGSQSTLILELEDRTDLQVAIIPRGPSPQDSDRGPSPVGLASETVDVR